MEIRIQPHSIESEEGILSCCLLDPNIFDEFCGDLAPESFYQASHQTVFSAISGLAHDGLEINEISVIERLRKDGTLDQIGGIGAIHTILDRIEITSGAKQFASVVIEKHKLRQLLRISREAVERCYTLEDPAEVTATLEADIIEINKTESEDSTISEATGELEVDLKSMMDGTYEAFGLPFGIGAVDLRFDEKLVGGSLTVVSAPTSCGKTQSAIHCVMKLAMQEGLPVGYVSYEMPAKQLSKRMLQCSSGVNLKKFRDGTASSSEQVSVASTIKKMKDITVLTEHRKRQIVELASLVRQWKRKHGIRLLVVDYLQLMGAPSPRTGLTESIAHNTSGLKALAMDVDIPIIVLSQVNRSAVNKLEEKPDRGLMTHDLIGSSSIENDADNILLFWPELGDPEESRAMDQNMNPYMRMKGQWAKQREGTRGERFNFKFIEAKGRFQD